MTATQTIKVHFSFTELVDLTWKRRSRTMRLDVPAWEEGDAHLLAHLGPRDDLYRLPDGTTYRTRSAHRVTDGLVDLYSLDYYVPGVHDADRARAAWAVIAPTLVMVAGTVYESGPVPCLTLGADRYGRFVLDLGEGCQDGRACLLPEEGLLAPLAAAASVVETAHRLGASDVVGPDVVDMDALGGPVFLDEVGVADYLKAVTEVSKAAHWAASHLSASNLDDLREAMGALEAAEEAVRDML